MRSASGRYRSRRVHGIRSRPAQGCCRCPALFTDVDGTVWCHLHSREWIARRLLLPEVIGAGGALFDYDNGR